MKEGGKGPSKSFLKEGRVFLKRNTDRKRMKEKETRQQERSRRVMRELGVWSKRQGARKLREKEIVLKRYRPDENDSGESNYQVLENLPGGIREKKTSRNGPRVYIAGKI